LSVGYFPVEYPELSTNTSDAVYTPDGTWTPDSKWVTVFLPSDPRLSPGQIKQARALAQALDYNVIQLPPRLRGPAARIVPAGLLGLRQKAPSASFPDSVLNMPCWGATHDYRTYKDQTSQAFFDQYASSPSTMGSYYIDGVKMTFAQFISKNSSS
jgi:hypothetical protein